MLEGKELVYERRTSSTQMSKAQVLQGLHTMYPCAQADRTLTCALFLLEEHSMTEFWKSNERKFCDICKCWFGDNKISTDIHEKGKSHQENVRNKIQQNRTETVNLRSAIRSKHMIRDKIAFAENEAQLAKKGKADAKAEKEKERILKLIDEKANAAVRGDQIAQRAQIETTWQEPIDGFYTIAEQRLLGLIDMPECIDQPSGSDVKNEQPAVSGDEPDEDADKETKDKKKSKKGKNAVPPRPKTPPSLKAKMHGETTTKIAAAPQVGKWTVVEEPAPDVESPGRIDETADIPMPCDEAPPPEKKRFSEKVAKPISKPGATVSFKKRKFAGSLRRKDSDD